MACIFSSYVYTETKKKPCSFTVSFTCSYKLRAKLKSIYHPLSWKKENPFHTLGMKHELFLLNQISLGVGGIVKRGKGSKIDVIYYELFHEKKPEFY